MTAGAIGPLRSEDVEQSIPARFERVVAAHGTRPAVGVAGREIDYAELDAMANRVAHAILAARGDAEEPIALLLEQGLSQVVAVLAVLKAGKIYVVLEPAHPRARNAYILQDAGAAVLLVERRTRDQARDLAPASVRLIDVDALGQDGAPASPRLALRPDRLAHILYTSGSTGPPKGVAASHRFILHEGTRVTKMFDIRADDRQTLLRSCGFSGATRDVFGSLLNGASVHPLSLEVEGMPRLAGWMREREITTFRAVISVLRGLVSIGGDAGQFPLLRAVNTGGESVNTSDVRLLAPHLRPDCLFVNGLGITEAGTVRSYPVDLTLAGVADGNLPVGYAMDDVEILLLDDRGDPVAPGATGEIAVRSRYLAAGYWRRPELTAARFRPDPRGGEARLYLTGDLGRLQPDGCLEHHGRKDFQVKVRGLRVEIGEIEAALLSLGTLREAVVVAREDAPGDRRLVAYVVPGTTDPAPSAAGLRRALGEALPAHMVPSAFVVLAGMPISAVGKVDRGALPAPVPARMLADPPVPPRTPVESRLVAIWAEVLDLEGIGIEDAFLDLGGDSLRASQIVARVTREFEIDVPLSMLFEAPTVAAMAIVVVRALAAGIDDDTLAGMLSDLTPRPDDPRPPSERTPRG